MSKAEKRAHECYPDDDVASIQSRFGFLLGYQQAEKDLELTWEDIKTIDKLLNQCVDYSNPYQEVLKRFKEEKGERHKDEDIGI